MDNSLVLPSNDLLEIPAPHLNLYSCLPKILLYSRKAWRGEKFGEFSEILSHSPIKAHQILERFSRDLSCGASCINDGMNTLQLTRANQLSITSMSILNYFKLKAKMNDPVEPRSELPDPNGPLSSTMYYCSCE